MKEGEEMPISVTKDLFKNIDEIWGMGPNTIKVVTAKHRTIRIIAGRNIRSGAEVVVRRRCPLLA